MKRVRGLRILVMPDFKPGDQAPEGYLQWHEWAEVQHKAGLRQTRCGRCTRFRYPQELSATIDQTKALTSSGQAVTIGSRVCNECAARAAK